MPGAARAGARLGALALGAADVTVPDLDLGHAVVPDLLPLLRGVRLHVGHIRQEEDSAAAHRPAEEAFGRGVGLGALHDPDVVMRRVRRVLEALRHVGHRDQLRVHGVGDVPDPRRRAEGVLLHRLQRIGGQLPGVGVVVGHHPAEVGTGLDAVGVPAGAGRPALQRVAGLGDAAGVAPEDGTELAGRGLRLLDQPLGGVGLEGHDRAGGTAVVGDVGAAHVGPQRDVAGEVVGVRQRALGVLLRPDDVLQRDVGDVADVPDRRQVGEEVAGHDRLARLPLVLHMVRLALDTERRRNLDEVHDLAVVLVR